ncbi:MAG TPA: methionyl-tRNA formyltransferase [Gemmatimonadaceae bacterium]|nr:methionyl-tRNA formyltransferase [Gemmatimonadaceae bacterium]
MRLAWIGMHAEGIPAFEALLAAGAPLQGAVTLVPELAAKRGGAGDYREVCRRYGVPLYYVADLNAAAARAVLSALAPDVVFVVGWHQFIRPETLRLARVGMISAHASLLPHNRGSAPINWAIIRGERETGNTLFWLAEEMDAGDIIDQTAFPIAPYDTAASLYERVAESTRDMLLRLLPRLLAGERPGRPQPPSTEPVLRRRRPADGRIDWTWSGQTIYDFVRALTRPYPGAFGTLEGRLWRIWQAALPPSAMGNVPRNGAAAGEILGPVVSPVGDACGQLVACGRGAVILLEVEAEDGRVLRGRALSEQPWTGRHWSND